MTKIVIFGANGFIGRHLVAKLAQNSDNHIIAFDRFAEYQKGSTHPFVGLDNVEICIGNFFNRNEVSRVLPEAAFVFHLVSSTTPATSDDDPLIDMDTNVRGSIELFQLCVEHQVGKIIYLSSGGTVYGNIDSEMISETSVVAPRSPYGIGKITIEHYLRYFKYKSGLNYIVYRVANPYGPGQNVFGRQGVIPIFMHKTLMNEPITVFGDGEMNRDYIYIEDLIEMIYASYSKPNKFSEYNIGSGQKTSVNDLIQEISACSGRKPHKLQAPIPPSYVQNSVLDISRFTKEFRIKPSTTLKFGLERTWNYVEAIQ